MTRFRFVMSDGTEYNVVAADFRQACAAFDQFGADPKEIEYIEER